MDWVCWLFLLGGLVVGGWVGFEVAFYGVKLAAKKIEFNDGDVWEKK